MPDLDGLPRYVVIQELGDQFEAEGMAVRAAVEAAAARNVPGQKFYVAMIVAHVAIPEVNEPVLTRYLDSGS